MKNRCFIHRRLLSTLMPFLLFQFILAHRGALAQSLPDINQKLAGFDQYMEKILKDWNVPGIAVGVVVKDKLAFAKGYGYRDYGQKLPVTQNTLFQIASNTKLFTATAIGLMVEDKKIDWDKPVRNYVPTIQFYNDELNNRVTIRDMLSHRTGISRHDLIWYKSDDSRKQLFEKIKYLEPSQALRQGYLYNNMMYIGAGQIVELLSGKPWEDIVRERIFKPLEMSHTVFTLKEMTAEPDHAVPYNEKRDTSILYEIPLYEDASGVGPAGAIISNLNDLSHWLIAQMNDGGYKGKQVIPPAVIKATLTPSLALPNTDLENRGYKEILNPVYCMGRQYASYRGHLLTFHGGALPGQHTQVSFMPYDSIGVMVFVIGDQGQPLCNVITYNVYERLLGMDLTPWSERRLADQQKSKELEREGRSKAAVGRVQNTKPSHALDDYTGQFEHSAYGILTVSRKDSGLQFECHHIQLPLSHFHYDRFDSPNDEQYGLWSLNYLTNPQGDLDSINISIDEGQVTFTRRPDPMLAQPDVLARYTGKYQAGGRFIEVSLSANALFLNPPGQPKYELIPSKPRIFKMKQFSDVTIEFIVENGIVKAMKQKDPSGEYTFNRQ